jgi:molybdopterin-guanine dinucleotide biosynthesis protein A
LADEPKVAGVLLAGGLGRRMGGGDKCLRSLAGRPILGHVIERVRPQVGPLVLNANGEPGRFAEFGLPVAPDVVEGFAGPLAGILTGLEWMVEHAPGCAWLASFATDAPFLPRDLVARLRSAIEDEGAELACATSNGRAHPVFGLWPARYRLATVAFPAEPIDPFFNANRPEDLAQAERLLAEGRRSSV